MCPHELPLHHGDLVELQLLLAALLRRQLLLLLGWHALLSRRFQCSLLLCRCPLTWLQLCRRSLLLGKQPLQVRGQLLCR